MNKNKAVELQRKYYGETASSYEDYHAAGGGEHDLACAILSAYCTHFKYKTILDVGSGTGRVLKYLADSNSGIGVTGVEPVCELRAVGHRNGISPSSLVDGDATNLKYNDRSFDVVSEFGVLHHVAEPRLIIDEMLRVAARAIFISDVNRFGHGSLPIRYFKRGAWVAGLWPVINWVKTRGKGYTVSEGDGVAYSYSVFDDINYIKSQCSCVYLTNLDGDSGNMVVGALHIGMLCIKK